MAQKNGVRVYGTSTTLHTGAGRLLGYIISHAETTSQAVIFYDNTAASGTILHKVNVSPESSPAHIILERDNGISFTVGLTVNPGNCDVAVWSTGFVT